MDDRSEVHLRAVRLLGDLADALVASGYEGQALQRLLARVLLRLFADDAGIVDREASPGASSTEHLALAERHPDVRDRLLACARFDWSRISPSVFGSLMQGIMDPRERRQTGVHYTSEQDILKVIRPLFLDEWRAEFERIRGQPAALAAFHERLAGLRLLDPACGCGDFLAIVYRELRLLEIEVLTALRDAERRPLDARTLPRVDVDAFHGIEIGPWPAQIAEVAMRLVDRQMNARLVEAFGQGFARPTPVKSPTIVVGNALRLDWKEILPPERCGYVLGNPPFVGAKHQTKDQRADMAQVAGKVKNHGLLDYAASWYFKAAEYIRGTRIVVGLVSTNSIAQGEQVAALWKPLLERFGVQIHFAHRTFAWQNDARRRARVHVVIVGFGAFPAATKRIYDYEPDGRPSKPALAIHINPYLVDADDVLVTPRATPLGGAPEIRFGNQPIDGGHFLLGDEEKDALVDREPEARRFVRQYLGAREFLHGRKRWCLWLYGATPRELRGLPEVQRRVEAVRAYRLASRRPATRDLAAAPTDFAFISHPDGPYLLIPSVSSERRRYIPMAFQSGDVVASNLCLIVPGASLFHFGVLTSAMHMAWVRQIAGRLESRYRYSNKLVYNNYPWPEAVDAERRAAVESASRAVLDVRETRLRSGATYAGLYNPSAMPPPLAEAHAALDRAVDACYGREVFTGERKRVELLLELYEKRIGGTL